MQKDNRFFDDLSKFLNGLAGTMAGMGREAQSTASERAREWFDGMDFVSREEFDAVKAMAATAREEADALKARVDALEKGTKPKAPAKKAPVKKAPAKKAPVRKPAAKKASPRKPAAPKT